MKVSVLKLVLIVGLSLVLQSSVVINMMPAGVTPDLMLIVVLLASLRLEEIPSLLLAFVSGLFQDFMSGKYVGPHIAGSLVAVYFLIVISKHVFADRALSLAFVCFLSIILKQSVSSLMVIVFMGFRDLSIYNLLPQIFLIALSSAFIAPLISILMFRAKIKR